MARRQRQSASASLIQGAGMVAKSQGFVNYAEAINSANPGQGENFYIKERERKAATKSRVNGYIENMKSNIDLDGLTAEQEGALRSFLMNERNIYANAANEIAKIDDASSPEYQYYVDIMNGVNRSFATLSEELKTYREAKSTYAEMHQADIYSNAASGDEIQMAASLYGLDPEVPAIFSVGRGGHLQFEVNGQMQSYKDYKEPMMKDYKTMDALLKTTNTIYSNGQKLTDTKINQLGLQIESMLANPETIKSLLSGDFASSGIDLSHIAYDPNDVAGTRMQLRDALVDGLIQVANEGYNEKESRKKPRGGGSGSGGSGGAAEEEGSNGYLPGKQGEYTMRVDDAVITADNNIKADGNGNEYGIGTPFSVKGVKYTPYVFVQPATDANGNLIEGQVTKKYVFKYTAGGQELALTYDELMKKISLK